MATYYNAYTLLEQVRVDLNEYSTAYVQGTDTTGKYLNAQIMRGINNAHRFLFNYLLPRIPYEFREETTLTGVNSVYTLPADFGVLHLFKDSKGQKISSMVQTERKLASQTGTDQRYYRKGNTLVIDRDAVTEACTLIYQRKCRDLDQGKATDGAATSITLAATASLIADYYNGMKIENITDGSVDTITDYTSGRVATISGTGAADDYYGIVPDIPEPFHHLIVPRAIFEITGNFPIVKEKPTKSGMQLWNDNLITTLKAYAGPAQDDAPEDVWTNYYESNSVLTPYNIPGHS